MHVRFWGTRGSIAKAGRSTLEYGGNTSCIEVRTAAGTLIVIDCGTGAHGLGKHLVDEAAGEPVHGHILISHTHWDHIQGLPFFRPLFDPRNSWRIYGPTGLGTSLSETLSGQMQYSYFPVTTDQMGGVADYHDLVEGCFEVDDVRVTTHYLNHPALTLGYRLEADDATLVYASDHEPHHRELAGGGDIASNRSDRAHADFIAGADLLIHDAQYRADEYADKAGWGHSTVEYVVDVARHARARRVALYHHDPDRSDAEVEVNVELARAHAAANHYDGDIVAAAEGLRLDVDASGGPTVDAQRSTIAATEAPAILSRHRSVLIAARTPAVAAALLRAAESEQVDHWSTSDPKELVDLARRHEPSIILIEAGDHRISAELIPKLRKISGESVAPPSIVLIGEPAAELATAVRDSNLEWMIWPSSPAYLRTKLRAWLLRRACRWQNARLPDDEQLRLQTLHRLRVLDTEPEDRFDRLTAEASALFDVPIALVSLVDTDRQWFKSHHGIDATETPRDLSFCAHVILDDHVMQVPDALDDPRFADNPLVAGDPNLRFYAGVPLTMSDGTHAGTLCVIDYRPRLLDDAQLAELRRLGDQVARELEVDPPSSDQ